MIVERMAVIAGRKRGQHNAAKEAVETRSIDDNRRRSVGQLPLPAKLD
jgi:hypothetical protein